ncbi:hypothetical protein EV702DRAFT_79966 [Suillus placidus]|uniref:Uncharacterized protein n=1 Tax=Suillus placidus TaxID=48579 RepID=A0A9P7D474_9AGAM|nr:hypothetical protein EV702DRAFT_79966 [Suillus placidus]
MSCRNMKLFAQPTLVCCSLLDDFEIITSSCSRATDRSIVGLTTCTVIRRHQCMPPSYHTNWGEFTTGSIGNWQDLASHLLEITLPSSLPGGVIAYLKAEPRPLYLPGSTVADSDSSINPMVACFSWEGARAQISIQSHCVRANSCRGQHTGTMSKLLRVSLLTPCKSNEHFQLSRLPVLKPMPSKNDHEQTIARMMQYD